MTSILHYKFVVLFAACLTQFLRGIFITGTIKVYPLYFEQWYGERVVSATIGSVQTAVVYLLMLPAMLLCNKFGPRLVQMIGGILACAGLAATAYTTESWQGMIANTVVAVGTAGTLSAPWSAIPQFFPGRQLAPYALLTCFSVIGSTVTPMVASFLMKRVGFTNNFIVSASVFSLTIFAGALYRSNSGAKDETSVSTKSPSISLKVKVKRQGIYTIKGNDDKLVRIGADQGTSKGKDAELGSSNRVNGNGEMKEHYLSRLLALMTENNSEGLDGKDLASEENVEVKEKSLYDVLSTRDGNTCIADLIEENTLDKKGDFLCHIFTNLPTMNVLAANIFAYGGIVAFFSILGDYAIYNLHFTGDQYTHAMLLLSISQMTISLLYIAVTKYFYLSSTMMMAASASVMAIISLLIIYNLTVEQFNGLMLIYGVFFTLFACSMFGCGMEVVPPEHSHIMYSVQTLFNGLGALTAPYAAAYIQVNVDPRGGLFMSGVLCGLAAVMLLPQSVINLMSPAEYSVSEGNARVNQTGYLPRYTM